MNTLYVAVNCVTFSCAMHTAVACLGKQDVKVLRTLAVLSALSTAILAGINVLVGVPR